MDIRPEKAEEVCSIQYILKARTSTKKTICYIMARSKAKMELECRNAIGGESDNIEKMIHGRDGWERIWPEVEKQT